MIDKYRPYGFVEQSKGAGEDVMLELGIPRTSEGPTQREPQCNARGGAVLTATSRTDDNTTVAIPAFSNTWASTLTVRVHSGQTGVSNTTSTPSARNAAAAAGARS